MTHWRTLVPRDSEYLQAADLGSVGTQVTVTIESIPRKVLEAEDGKNEERGVLRFVGKQKGLPLINIVGFQIEAMFGTEWEDWVGHSLTLHVVPCEVKGQFYGVPSIRVKGSPELERPIHMEVKLPRRKPLKYTLVPTGNPSKPAADPNPQPEPETSDDTDTIPFIDDEREAGQGAMSV